MPGWLDRPAATDKGSIKGKVDLMNMTAILLENINPKICCLIDVGDDPTWVFSSLLAALFRAPAAGVDWC